MKTKREAVLSAIRNEDWLGACKLAKDFNRDFPKADQKIIGRAFEMSWNPGFYEQLGFKAEVELEKAKSILVATYGGAL